MTIIALIGSIGSGKDTVTNILVEKYGYHQQSFAAPLKDVCAALFNWPRDLLEGKTDYSRQWREQVDPWWATELQIPDFTPRWALTHIGTEVLRNNFDKNLWIHSLQNRLCYSKKNIVVSDARFKNEIQALQSMSAIIVEVVRHPKPAWWDHACVASSSDIPTSSHDLLQTLGVHESEWAWASTTPDIKIFNTGTLDDLHKQVEEKLCF